MNDPTNLCMVIAEIGVNHDGSVDRAFELIDAAKVAGADAVKFQSFTAATLAADTADLADYQKKQVEAANQVDMLTKLELTHTEFSRLYEYCDSKAIEFMSTAFDEDWLDFLIELGIGRVKWPSGELTNLGFLERAARSGLPIVLSTGMADLDEIAQAVQVVQDVWGAGDGVSVEQDLTILHCTSLYPAPLDTLNLAALTTIKNAFNVRVGYSDHSEGTLAAPICVGLGATVFEKHLTYDRSAVGPDHSASLEPREFAEYVSIIRTASGTLGRGEKSPHALELDTARAARKSLFLRSTLPAGAVITSADLGARRPGTGIGVEHTGSIVGRTLRRETAAGKMLDWDDLSE